MCQPTPKQTRLHDMQLALNFMPSIQTRALRARWARCLVTKWSNSRRIAGVTWLRHFDWSKRLVRGVSCAEKHTPPKKMNLLVELGHLGTAFHQLPELDSTNISCPEVVTQWIFFLVSFTLPSMLSRPLSSVTFPFLGEKRRLSPLSVLLHAFATNTIVASHNCTLNLRTWVVICSNDLSNGRSCMVQTSQNAKLELVLLVCVSFLSHKRPCYFVLSCSTMPYCINEVSAWHAQHHQKAAYTFIFTGSFDIGIAPM